MNTSKVKDLQILAKVDGEFYLVEPKENIQREISDMNRRLIFDLFKDHHTFKKVDIKSLNNFISDS
jgi:hypothetical protein